MLLRKCLAWGVVLATAQAGFVALAQELPPPAVVVAPAEVIDLRPTAGFTGRLVAHQKVEIRARVSGFVEAINFTEGATVAEGDVLYEIEDTAYRAAVVEAEGTIGAAEAERRLAEIERDRKAQLVARAAVAQSELDIAEAQLGKAEGTLAQLNGALDRARLDLSYTSVTAPFAGRVGLSAVDVGALVGLDTGPLTTLTLLDPIQAEFPVATALFLEHQAAVRAGKATDDAVVTLTLADGSTYPSKGDIDFVDAEVARGTDTVLVRASFLNSDGILLDGALVRVTLQSTVPQMVLTVPQQAVQRDQVGAFVMVVDDASTVALRRVELGQSAEGRTAITSGIAEGENVITDGVNKARPGITVTAAPATGG